jgi:hypothetical protein
MVFKYLARMAFHNLVDDFLASPAEPTGEQRAKTAPCSVAARRRNLDIWAFNAQALTQLLFRSRCCLRVGERRRYNPHLARVVHGKQRRARLCRSR